jgi:hypothetical protein
VGGVRLLGPNNEWLSDYDPSIRTAVVVLRTLGVSAENVWDKPSARARGYPDTIERSLRRRLINITTETAKEGRLAD